jgi:hypothetical protein
MTLRATDLKLDVETPEGRKARGAIMFAPGALGLHGIRYSEEISTLPMFASQADLQSSNWLSKAG